MIPFLRFSLVLMPQGVCLPEGHFIGIPPGAVLKRPSGIRTPLYIALRNLPGFLHRHM